MRVLLMVAPWSFSELVGEEPRPHRPDKDAALIGVPQPLGLLSIAATLKQAGHAVEVADGYFESLPEILERVARFRPDVVGLSTYHCLWDNTKQAIEDIKARFPHIRTIVGGPADTMPRAECLTDCPQLDFAVDGEGELVMKEFLEALADDRPLDGIHGLIHRGDDGRIVRNKRRQALQDLNSLPFPSRDPIPLDRYIASLAVMGPTPFANVVTTRGCPHRCGFCPIGDETTHGKVRMRNAASIIDEVTYLVERHGVRSINFYDDFPTFALDHSAGEEIAHALIAKRYNLKWTMNVFTYTSDEAYMALLKRAGLWRVQCLGPSAVQKNADRLQTSGRGVPVAHVAKGIETIHRAGIQTVGKFILGIPGETREEAHRTIRYACGLPLDFAIFMPVPIFPDSPMYREQEKKGLRPGDAKGRNIFHIHVDQDSLPADEIRKLILTAYGRFYLRPGYLARQALALRSTEEIALYLRYVKRVYHNLGRYVYHPIPAGHM